MRQERAVHVARVSQTGQDEEGQVPDLEEWSRERAYTVIDTLRIHGKSAFHGKHLEELYKAVRLVELDRADVVVIWAVDRSSRQGAEAALRFRRDVMNAGGRVEIATEPELNAAPGRAEEELQKAWADAGHVAWLESKKRVARIKNGNIRAMGNGAALRKPKYAYVLSGPARRKAWAVDDSRAVVVKGMYERAASGETLRAIAGWAREQDPEGGQWDASRVRKILTDPAYAGRAETSVNGQPYTYQCPAIVDERTWQVANASIREPKRYVRAAVSPFAGIILCGLCDAVMRRTSPGGGPYRVTSSRYWRCPNGCGNVRYDEWSARVHQALMSVTAEMFEEVIVKPQDMRAVRLTLLEAELKGIGSKGLSPAGMIQRISEISAEIEAIKAEPAPRGRIRRKGTGVSVGVAYRALNHDDPAAVNAWLKAHNVRAWCGGPTAEITVRESSRLGAEGQVAYAENGLVVTWWLTED